MHLKLLQMQVCECGTMIFFRERWLGLGCKVTQPAKWLLDIHLSPAWFLEKIKLKFIGPQLSSFLHVLERNAICRVDNVTLYEGNVESPHEEIREDKSFHICWHLQLMFIRLILRTLRKILKVSQFFKNFLAKLI